MACRKPIWAVGLLLALALVTAGCATHGDPDAIVDLQNRHPVVPDTVLPDGAVPDVSTDDGGVDSDASAPNIDPPLYSDGLAVIQVTTDPTINRDEYTPALITYRGHRYEGAEAKYRGQSAYKYPKKSYTLKFAKDDPFAAANGEPDGFINSRKIALGGSFDDNSYLRQALAFELWNRSDSAHVQVHTRFAVLELNGNYQGLYLMIDHVDEYLMQAQGLSKDGNLFKARTHEATLRNMVGEKPRSPHKGFTKEEGEPEQGETGAFADLDALATWLNQASDEELDAELSEHIEVDEFIDWWILVTLIDGRDSAGKNSYYYHDPRESLVPSLFHCVPWDFNASFGQAWDTKRVPSSYPITLYERRNLIFERILASDKLRPYAIARYQKLLQAELSLREVQHWVATTRPKIERAARHDEEYWGEDYRAYKTWKARTDFTSYEQESAYLDGWIAERWLFIEEELEKQ